MLVRDSRSYAGLIIGYPAWVTQTEVCFSNSNCGARFTMMALFGTGPLTVRNRPDRPRKAPVASLCFATAATMVRKTSNRPFSIVPIGALISGSPVIRFQGKSTFSPALAIMEWTGVVKLRRPMRTFKSNALGVWVIDASGGKSRMEVFPVDF